MARGYHRHRKEHSINARKFHRTGGYLRERVKEPSEFEKGSFRTIDPGRPGYHKLVIGRLKGSKRTTTQAILHPKEDSIAKARAFSKRRRIR